MEPRTQRKKSPLPEAPREGWTHDIASYRTASPTHYRLSYSSPKSTPLIAFITTIPPLHHKKSQTNKKQPKTRVNTQTIHINQRGLLHSHLPYMNDWLASENFSTECLKSLQVSAMQDGRLAGPPNEQYLWHRFVCYSNGPKKAIPAKILTLPRLLFTFTFRDDCAPWSQQQQILNSS